MQQTASVETLKGVGPKLAERLRRLGLERLSDLALHLPMRYQNRTEVVAVARLAPGDEALVEGELTSTAFRGARGRAMLLCTLKDAAGDSLSLRFFHASATGLRPGVWLRCYGELRAAKYDGGLEMTHPEYRQINSDEPPPVPSLTPVYPTTEGLHQAALRRQIDQALALSDDELGLGEQMPEAIAKRFSLMSLAESVRLLHAPPPAALAEISAGRHPAQRRLAFEELLSHQLSLRELRLQIRAHQAPGLSGGAELRQQFLGALSFPLTGAQRRASDDIINDLADAKPMLRLLQGDVGSGKTVVAALAALTAIAHGKQAALMAPTELLSEQLYRNMCSWLEPLGVTVAWLTGRLKSAERAAALAAVGDGTAQLAVGTHALFQDAVAFADLALVIVDEQHRFGVHQRLALRRKGAHPHQLIMTATPIPRTLAMSAYADLDTSIIDELPPGRTPVTTVAVADTRRDEVIKRISEVSGEGRQTYWVCTLVEESEVLQAQDAEQTAEKLAAALPDLNVGLIHGRQKGEEKERVMAAFKNAELDLLVATTVIEVGVDVPAASLMIIENPERLGLAQLHQLRGRVGRGAAASHCVLLYRQPLTATARARLAVLRDTTDGFIIAEKDLELRGPGEVLGTRQTGDLQFRVADLRRDAGLLPPVRDAADALLRDHPQAAAAIAKRWRGGSEVYGEV